jgi:hypothetical protein
MFDRLPFIFKGIPKANHLYIFRENEKVRKLNLINS